MKKKYSKKEIDDMAREIEYEEGEPIDNDEGEPVDDIASIHAQMQDLQVKLNAMEELKTKPKPKPIKIKEPEYDIKIHPQKTNQDIWQELQDNIIYSKKLEDTIYQLSSKKNTHKLINIGALLIIGLLLIGFGIEGFVGWLIIGIFLAVVFITGVLIALLL